jgi:hypothetical protein
MIRTPTRITGRATRGFGAATDNLRGREPLIAARIGLPSLIPGTFNISLDAPFLVQPDAALSAIEYNGWEVILLQRCTIFGRAAVIARPHTHEIEPKPGELRFGHGIAHIELMASFDITQTFAFTPGEAVEVEVLGDERWWETACEVNWGPRRASGTR